MTTKEKIGLAGLIALFVIFAVALVWTVKPDDRKLNAVEDSVFVRQRMINLDKSK